MAGLVAYDPNDATQAAFLSALGVGETGGGANSLYMGYSGVDLSKYQRDQYGFPQWPGIGNTHAAGTYQFQPGTWQAVAQEFGLNFGSQADQNAGAWYLAQQTYADKTGGSLEDALRRKDIASVKQALEPTWPSITGRNFAQAWENGVMTETAGGLLGGLFGGDGTSSPVTGSGGLLGQLGSAVADPFIRIALLVIGGIIILIALWKLLSDTGVIISPEAAAKAAVAVL